MSLSVGFGLVIPSSLLASKVTRLESQSYASEAKLPIHPRRTLQCMITEPSQTIDRKIDRRSASYQPSIWDYNYVQSLNSKYAGDEDLKWAAMLKEDVKTMLDQVVDPLDGLGIIDDLQRLGVFYHFEDEIKRILESTYNHTNEGWDTDKDLQTTSLKFRLLRQHGYTISEDVFKNFKDEIGNFKTCLCEDIKGLLYLYEASYFSLEGERILEEARDFTTKNLKKILKRKDMIDDEDLAILVSHALEVPTHWRMQRLEARWFIDMYERRPNLSPTLLQLAKLDFNMVQATHQEDLKHMSRWWNNTGLGQKLSFARDRLMENFLWAIGLDFKPQISYFRKNMTIVTSLITTIDDVYDVYGTLDELERFTNAVERWDLNEMEHLPAYMKICFLALFNSINEMGYDTLKEQGVHIIPYLQKMWTDLCKSFLVEAKWYYSRYTPSFEEYMNNGWMSASATVILAHAYVLCTNPISKEGLKCVEKYPDLIRCSATIFRLANDLATSTDEMERGEIPKSIQCYMHETGASEKDARKHMKYLIDEAWKKMNEARVENGSLFSRAFIGVTENLARMAQCTYQYGDGHGAQGPETRDRVKSLLINPIPLFYNQLEETA
ncbi:(-)-alpha-terpineol synthase [Actinidia chinensis var. chinensis]|uniref:(-)-alpha-terpineol synthase n=1 Tax=Actinidia chinensis var. chinensis TaxID=1590841 RepID=A0A2R6P2R6_ACTCC|nr:(-)-alpha-terpineol synthase [Actinidia chinensis var. chinensis]